MSASETIEKMIEVLERDGWCRGALKNAQGQRCVVGALHAVSNGPEAANVFRYLLRVVPSEEFFNWNDLVAKDQADVILKLRLAMAIAKSEEMAQ